MISLLENTQAQLITIAATGHRLNRLGGNCLKVRTRLEDLARASIQREKLKPAAIISGMAQGWDLAMAAMSIELKIPLIAAVPFADQSINWKTWEQQKWQEILDKAQEVVYIDSLTAYAIKGLKIGTYHPAKYQKRNEWLVDNCHKIIALYDGSGKGGTFNCLEYAKQFDKPVLNTWNSWVKYSGLLN